VKRDGRHHNEGTDHIVRLHGVLVRGEELAGSVNQHVVQLCFELIAVG
jgi:hypothetical protein